MAIQTFNSVDGFSVGNSKTTVINGAANISANSLTVSANANVTGNITAARFYGEGGNLSNIQGANITGAVSFANVANSVAGANVTGSVAFANVANSVAGANVTDSVAFANVANSVAGANVSGAVSYANVANSVAGANVIGTVANASFATTSGTTNSVAGANVTGEVAFAATANSVLGSNITGQVNFAATANSVAGGNVSGAVGLATFATTANTVFGGNVSGTVASATSAASANSVAGANVSGTVASATVAASANAVAGANVSGEVSFAATANAVAGANVSGTVASATVAASANAVAGANVSGTVASATSADSANSVAGANVSGTVASATSAASANSVAGANVSGEVGLATFATTANSVAGGNVSGAVGLATFATTANSVAGANVTGTVATATTAGTVTTAAQPNITSVGTLTSVTVSGNANVGNIGTTALVATGSGSFGANVNMNSFNINNLATPVANTDAATKAYVDGLASTGLIYHDSVKVATTTTLAVATGGTITYNNGASGVGANIVTTGSFTTIDTVSVAVVGTRILVKNESNAALNGVYTYANSTTIVRATDADTYGTSAGDLSENDYFFVLDGSVNKGTAHVCNTTGTITFGTTDITFATFSTSQVYTAGTGLSLNSTEFSITNTTVSPAAYGGSDTVATFTVNQQGQLTAASNVAIQANAANLSGTTLNATVVGSSLTSVGTLASLAVTGNISAGNVSATTFTGALSGAATSAATAGTVTTAAQPNITSTGTLTSLTVTGNVTGGNLVTAGKVYASEFIEGGTGIYLSAGPAGYINFFTTGGDKASISDTGNIIASNVIANSTVFATTANISGNVNAGNVYANSGTIGASLLTGTLTTAAQPNITSVGTLTNLTVSGVSNLNAIGNVKITGGTSGQSIITDGAGNLSFTSVIPGGGYVFQQSSAATTWTINHNLGYQYVNIQIIDATGNSWTGRYDYPTINFANSTTTVVTFTSAQAGWAALTIGSPEGAGTAGTVTTNAQPNITSVGTLTTLAVSGVSNLNAVGNVIITGGTSGQVLTTNGSGNLSWTSTYSNTTANAFMAGGVVGDIIPAGNNVANLGSPTNQFKDLFLSNATLYFNGAGLTVGTSNGVANTLIFNSQPVVTSSGNSSLTTTGNVEGGYIIGNGSSLSSITGANVTGTVASATVAASANAVAGANVSGQVANALVAGTVYTNAQPNITSVGTLTSLTVTSNVTAGNLVTGGILSVTGTGVSSIAGNLDMTSNNIVNLAAPVNSTDAATKQYVDDVAQGLHTHDSCNAATTTTLATISGGTVTYNNGTSGVGATLTTTGTYTTIDGVTLSNGMRILVKNEVTDANNGIYVRTSATVLTRADDFDTPAEMAGGDFTFVTAGTQYDNTGWVMTDPVTTVGTTPVTWVQFSGAGTYTAGTGLTLTGTVFSVNVAQPTITSVGTLTSLTVTGNGTFGNINTSGTETATRFISNIAIGTAPLTVTSTTRVANLNVAYSNVADYIGTGVASSGNFNLTLQSGTTGNIQPLGNTAFIANASNGALYATTFVGALSGAATSATTAGTVTTAAQPNITSVGTLTSLAVSGVSNLNAVGNVIITGGTNGQYLQTNGSGNLVWSTVASGASSNISNGTSNVSIAASGGNVTVGVGGTANVIVASTGGANVTGNIGVTGNVTANNLSAGNIVVVGGFTITAVGTKLVFSYGGANIFSLNSTGNIIASNNVTAFGTP
jgi:hypothetical protein